MTFTPEVETFIRDYLKEIQEHNAAIFAGAGLSMGSRAVDWPGLLRDFAVELKLDVEKESDLVTLTQFYLNHHGQNRSSINQKLLAEFHHGLYPNDNHRLLARMPIATYWTTNYDKLLEMALSDAGKIVDVKHSVRQLAVTVPGRDVTVYKMHGDVDLPQDTILSKDEYERYHVTHGAFLNALSGDLTGKTFLFIGFSFTDPNLDYVLSRIRIAFKENQRHHYCIFREVKRKTGETDESFLYRQIRLEHAIKDLQRFNIRVLIVKEFEEITQMLAELERRFKQRTICISGSAAVCDPYPASEAQAFISKLARELVKRNHKVVSGFGTDVGSHVINGVLEEVYINQKKTLKDQLLLRPFPAGAGKETFDQYREDMLAYAGIAIFVFGNKLEPSGTAMADGVRKEFDIAEKNGMLLLPVGCTGHVAKELWERVWKSYDRYFPGRVHEAAFQELGQSGLDLNRAVELILSILTIPKK
jgi:hypothetical protein